MAFLPIKAVLGRPVHSEKDLLQHFNAFPMDIACFPSSFPFISAIFPHWTHRSNIYTLPECVHCKIQQKMGRFQQEFRKHKAFPPNFNHPLTVPLDCNDMYSALKDDILKA